LVFALINPARIHFMRPARQAALGVSTLLSLLLLTQSYVLAQAPEDFFGVWADDGVEPLKQRCLHAIEMSEGAWLYLDSGLYDEGTGWLCQDLKFWVHEKKLRMSATCSSEESGESFIPRTAEFEMIRPNVMRRVGKKGDLHKCAGPFTGRPSFSCNGPLDSTGKAVCEHKDIADHDQRMSLIYNSLMTDASPSAKRSLETAQKAWVGTRNACGADYDCINTAYMDRIDALMKAVGK
jgi:hypothetical protein